MDQAGLSRRDVLAGLGIVTGSLLIPRLTNAAPRELKFGLTPVFLTNDLELLARLRSYLERAMDAPVRLVTRRTYQEITSLLVSGNSMPHGSAGFLSSRTDPSFRLSPYRSGAVIPSIGVI